MKAPEQTGEGEPESPPPEKGGIQQNPPRPLRCKHFLCPRRNFRHSYVNLAWILGTQPCLKFFNSAHSTGDSSS